jgi:hypothetical protein
MKPASHQMKLGRKELFDFRLFPAQMIFIHSIHGIDLSSLFSINILSRRTITKQHTLQIHHSKQTPMTRRGKHTNLKKRRTFKQTTGKIVLEVKILRTTNMNVMK